MVWNLKLHHSNILFEQIKSSSYYIHTYNISSVYDVRRDTLLTSLCPQPGSEAAGPLAEEEHEEGGQTRSQAAVCGAGEELFLGCVC